MITDRLRRSAGQRRRKGIGQIGHAGDTNDLDYLTELADAGVLLGMDRFGLDVFNPTAERVKTIAALASRGYAPSMVLAHGWRAAWHPLPLLIQFLAPVRTDPAASLASLTT